MVKKKPESYQILSDVPTIQAYKLRLCAHYTGDQP